MCNAVCAMHTAQHTWQEAGHKTPENRKFSTQVSWRGPHLALGLHVISKLCHICWRVPPFKTTNYFWKYNTKAVTRMTKLKTLQMLSKFTPDCWPNNKEWFWTEKFGKYNRIENTPRKIFLCKLVKRSSFFFFFFIVCGLYRLHLLFIIHFQTVKR